MHRRLTATRSFSLLMALALTYASDAQALILTREGLLRMLTLFADNPSDKSIYAHDSDAAEQLFVHEAYKLKHKRLWRLEADVYNQIIGTSAKDSLLSLLTSATDESNRSSHLERHWHSSDSMDAYLTVDRLALTVNIQRLRATAGRFPINLSVMQVFRPNDLFAPFRGQNAYRKHKPGVDGAEVELGLGQLTRVNLYGVRGYDNPSPFGRVGQGDKDNHFSYEQSAIIGQFTTTVLGYEWGALGGKYGFYDIYGFSMQGEAGDWFGVRAEGHQKSHRRLGEKSTQLNAGIARRIGERFLLNCEYFSHGAGYASADDYGRIATDDDPPRYYLGRQYTSVGGNFEVTGLTKVAFLMLSNWSDSSSLYVSSISYALAEDAEFVLSSYNKQGKPPKDGELHSEYGSYPNMITADMNFYW